MSRGNPGTLFSMAGREAVQVMTPARHDRLAGRGEVARFD
jgi:hypothetical protein